MFFSPENGVRLFDVNRKHTGQSVTQSFFISGIFGFRRVYHRSEVIAEAGSKRLQMWQAARAVTTPRSFSRSSTPGWDATWKAALQNLFLASCFLPLTSDRLMNNIQPYG
jgi:hypothetical protein